MANRNPKYAVMQTVIETICKKMVSQITDNGHETQIIIAQPISSGKMLLKIFKGDSFISKYMVIRFMIISQNLLNVWIINKVRRPYFAEIIIKGISTTAYMEEIKTDIWGLPMAM